MAYPKGPQQEAGKPKKEKGSDRTGNILAGAMLFLIFVVLVITGFVIRRGHVSPSLEPQKVLIGEYIDTGGGGWIYSYGGMPSEDRYLLQTGSRQYFYSMDEIPGAAKLAGHNFTILGQGSPRL